VAVAASRAVADPDFRWYGNPDGSLIVGTPDVTAGREVPPVTGIKFDAAWVGGYAKLTAASAEALDEGTRTMAADPLTEESFGELGRTTHSTQAYARTATHLRDQLARAVAALSSASTGLNQVTKKYVEVDEDGAATVNRGEASL
jgi:hypothetical protein